MYDLKKENFRKVAVDTISDIWACIDWDKIDARRAYGIWDEFGSKIKASAMSTNSYERFVDKLCKKMDVRSLRYSSINKISQESDEFKEGVLKVIREETLQLVLQVRLNNEARKEMNKKLKEKAKKQEELQDDYNNTQVLFTNKGVKIDE